MMQSWAVERMAAEHRRDLTALTRTGETMEAEPSAMVGSDGETDWAMTRPGVLKRPVGEQVGTLLIRMGTRLGGASIRTS
jgi:hypothetical protein